MKGYNAHEVKMLATNQWKTIFLHLAPQLKEAIENTGRHVACPVHGGADGFRLFPHFNAKGDGICNTCGAKTDGFTMLMWVNQWSFSQAVNAVGELLGASRSIGDLEYIEPKSFEGYYKGKRLRNRNKGIILGKTKDSDRFETFTLYGADLQRACQALKYNDYVRVTKFAHKKVVVNNQQVDKAIWAAKIIPTPEQRREQEAEFEQLKQERSAHRAESIKKVWSDTFEISDTREQAQPVLRYFANRYIATYVDSKNVRCAKDVSFFENGKFIGKYPALICAVRDKLGRVVSIHRTYLTLQGQKADVKEPKKLMAVPDNLTINGAAIRLVQTSKHVIGIAEGVETALSVVTATGLPCWSVISEGGMRHFEPPKGIQFVHIFADKDRSKVGEEAAKELQARLKAMGIGSRIYVPSEPIPEGAKGIDWNDVLRIGGSFPRFV